MVRFLPDTSCMVAAVCGWHEHHDRAMKEIGRRLNRGERMIVAAPALIETYAVLTRLPPPHRLSLEDTLELLERNFIFSDPVVLDVERYQSLLRSAPEDGIVGGQIYDAVIAACALSGKATTLLTFNETDFKFFAGRGITIVVPS